MSRFAWNGLSFLLLKRSQLRRRKCYGRPIVRLKDGISRRFNGIRITPIKTGEATMFVIEDKKCDLLIIGTFTHGRCKHGIKGVKVKKLLEEVYSINELLEIKERLSCDLIVTNLHTMG